ncbi:MAG: right-handed parallel beta-helix repeat-containing protein [Microthrixaceae bacterium]
MVGLTFERFASRHADGAAAVVVDGADDIDFTDVTIRGASGRGLYLGKGAGRLRGAHLNRVTVSDNGAVGVDVNRVDGLVVDRSVIERNNASRFGYLTTPGPYRVLAGMKLTGSTATVVTDSRFADNEATGLWFDLFCDGATIRRSVFRSNALHGLFFEVSRGAAVERNVVARNGTGTLGSGVRLTGAQDVVMRHNTFVAPAGEQVLVADDRRSDGPAWHTGSTSVLLESTALVDRADRPTVTVATIGSIDLATAVREAGNAVVGTPTVLSDEVASDYRLVRSRLANDPGDVGSDGFTG